MKNTNKIFLSLFLLIGVLFTSCETIDLELLDDPNNVTEDKADLERYLVSIQVDFADFMQRMSKNGAELTRIEYMFGRTYVNNFSAETTNIEWELAYQAMFSNMKGAESIAELEGANNHIGVMRILKAFTLMTLVDFYGDVPLSEATNPAEFPFPSADDDAAVYAEAMTMLDEGIAFLNAGGDPLVNDFYYGNDFSKWIRLANTLKMRGYLTTRLINSDAINQFNAIVSSGNYISSSDDDFQWQYGNSPSSPNTRHPEYALNYTVTGATGGAYRANWIMDLMLNTDDPRRFYYFFRQSPCTPGSVDANGNSCATNSAQIQCSTQARPQHYPASMAYCNLASGYWGRDHGNDEGIPPDNFRRTLAGIYPFGGKYDSGTNRDGTVELNANQEYEFVYNVNNNAAAVDSGLMGAGILPLVLASTVDFWRAEIALVSGNASAASQLVASGINKSITKVTSFTPSSDPDYDPNLLLDTAIVDPATGDVTAPNGPNNEPLPIFSGELVPTAADITEFVNSQASQVTNTSDDSWNILAEQYFVNLYGDGIDAYNFYRRTGYPKTLQFNIESASGSFVRSFLYPANEATSNNNIIQKENVSVKVFWDNNPDAPAFPFSN